MRVAVRALGVLAAGLLMSAARLARAAEDPAECPDGTHRVTTENPYQPFRCVAQAQNEGLGAVNGPQGFKLRPKCPRGTRAVAAQGLQPYRCVRTTAGDPDPELVPIKNDENLVRRAPSFGKISANKGREAYRRYTIPGEMSLDYPSLFQPRDGWREEVPTLSFTLDDGSPGKPVMITITKVERQQPTFIDLDAALAKDKDWQGARDGGSLRVAGLQARVSVVAGDSKTVYVPLSKAAYYTLVYSAPVEAYEVHLGAFNRLLKTLRVTGPKRGNGHVDSRRTRP